MTICTCHLGTTELDVWRLQAWTLARVMIDLVGEPGIILTDVDGTVLDTGPYDQSLVEGGHKYPAFWDEYVRSATPMAISGARRCLTQIWDRHVIWYISSRREDQSDDTRRQLEMAGLPMGAVICVGGNERKRAMVQELMRGTERRPIIQIGDQLCDIYLVDGLQSVMIPNPTYGSWTRDH